MATGNPKEEAIAATLVGRTIVEAVFVDIDPGHTWEEHEVLFLKLDDGRVVRCGGYGYDAWGATLDLIDAMPDGA